MPDTESAVETISFRVRKDLKRKVEEAASLSGLTITAFAKSVLSRSAMDVLEHHRETILTDRDRDRLLDALDNVAEPTETLLEAAELHKTLITE